MNRSHCQRFPIEIQEIICSYLLADDSSNRLALKIMRVNKAWGIFVCERLYR
jgi:hypothetical protein